LPTAYTCSGARDNAGNLTPPVTQPILLNIGFSWLGKSLTTPPATTTASRGSSVQVNFKLTVGSTTLSTLGAVKAIDYRTVDCKRWTSQNPWATAQPAPGTALSYVPLTTSYNLVWKTPKVTGCYELRITLADNLENFARIKLT
ncbi:MAG TPA: PxKF domain-containing protein, partial [Phycicoccus sp.]|nr:PxKF domain-containing protein [Phycicoccus sp.]